MKSPKLTVTTVFRHEWTIGEDYSEKTTARDLSDGIRVAQQEMKALGVNLDNDDCYFVRAGDGGQIILFVDIEKEEK